jgi:hypothetical protein
MKSNFLIGGLSYLVAQVALALLQLKSLPGMA